MSLLWHLLAGVGIASSTSPTLPASDSVVALVGGTVIDGNGGVPLSDATLVIRGDRIVALGPRATTTIPAGARRIDVGGKYLTPGFIDTNVHVTPYTFGGIVDQGSEAGKITMALDAAREFLAHGITTICDTWGVLRPSLIARDSLRRGELVGARLLIAGNIIGIDGESAELTQGMGRALAQLPPDSLRTLIEQYLDKGVDFIKIAVTEHSGMGFNPAQLLFSPDALETMVRAAHQRGKIVESHTQGIEGLRLAVRMGVDVVQHPEILTGKAMPDDLARLLAERKIICAMMTVAGSATVDDSVKGRNRENTKTLIRNGCLIAIATDDMYSEGNDGSWGYPNAHHVWGEWTLRGIEELVTLGMTPSQAITAATKHGAIAAGAVQEYGTLAVGKYADVLVLRANPLIDIHNIRTLDLVLHGGHVLTVPPPSSGTSTESRATLTIVLRDTTA